MFYTYILKSRLNNSYYIGSCSNLKNRIDLHNKGRVKSTKRYILWDIIYYEEFNNLKNARQRELQIKSWKKRKTIENLIKHFKKLI